MKAPALPYGDLSRLSLRHSCTCDPAHGPSALCLSLYPATATAPHMAVYHRLFVLLVACCLPPFPLTVRKA